MPDVVVKVPPLIVNDDEALSVVLKLAALTAPMLMSAVPPVKVPPVMENVPAAPPFVCDPTLIGAPFWVIVPLDMLSVPVTASAAVVLFAPSVTVPPLTVRLVAVTGPPLPVSVPPETVKVGVPVPDTVSEPPVLTDSVPPEIVNGALAADTVSEPPLLTLRVPPLRVSPATVIAVVIAGSFRLPELIVTVSVAAGGPIPPAPLQPDQFVASAQALEVVPVQTHAAACALCATTRERSAASAVTAASAPRARARGACAQNQR